MKAKNLLPLVFVSASVLLGCGNSSSVSSLREALSCLCSKKNYRIDFIQGGGTVYSHVYTKKYIGVISSYRSYTDVYYQDKNGVYGITFDSVDYVYRSSEYLDETDVWNSSYVTTMYGVEKEYVSSIGKNETEITITDKSYKLALLETLGFDVTDIVHLNAVTASYEEDHSVDLVLEFSTITYNYNINSFGSASWKDGEKYVKEGGSAYVPDTYQSLFREKIRGNNFARLVYDFEAEGYTFTEVFHPHYFYTKYSSSSYAGVMSMNWEGEDYPYELKGVYGWTSSEGNISFSSICLSENPDVTVYYHYPSYLRILDHLSYLKSGQLEGIDYSVSDSSGKSQYYYIDSVKYRDDFISNFSIDSSFPTDTYVPYGLAVQVIDLDTEDGMVIFYYSFTYGETIYTMPIPLGNFGLCGDAGLDTIYDYYNNR